MDFTIIQKLYNWLHFIKVLELKFNATKVNFNLVTNLFILDNLDLFLQ